MSVSRLKLALDQTDLRVPPSGLIGVLRADPKADYTGLPKDRLVLSNSNRPAYDTLKAQGYNITSTAEGPLAMSLVHVTRAKAETLGLIAKACQATEIGAPVIIDGSKTDGIDSVLKQVKSLLPIGDVVAKAHGKLFWFTRPPDLPEAFAEWQSALKLRENPDGFLTAPGMFSPVKTDPGSALLAGHFDKRLKGRVADLGAGWGWLANEALKKGEIERLDLYEAEKTALKAAEANISDARAQFFWVDVLTLPAERHYDCVIANPPFHQGRAAEPQIGLGFIRKAADILLPGGTLWLVANRQLPYEACLDQCFGHVKTLEQTPHFKVFLAERPRSGSARTRHANPVRSR